MRKQRDNYRTETIEITEGYELHVIPWLNMITDQVDIRNGVKIERHYYTPASLKTDAPENWTKITEAIEAAKKSRIGTGIVEVAGNSRHRVNVA